MNVTIRVRNAGYAPLYNARKAYIVLKNGSKTYSLPLTVDLRRWLPNGAKNAINEQVAVPSDIPEDTYQLYLHLPDIHASIAQDPRYAIRLANEGVWDSATGMNDLGATVTVSSAAPQDPGALPEMTALTTTTAATTGVRKIVENNAMYILRNGVRYTADGMRIQ
jgi:hypothetical protein